VETIRRDVEAEMVGLEVTDVRATGIRTLRRYGAPHEFAARVRDRRLVAVGRRGKYLLLHLEGGDAVVVHLGMSGQLLVATRGTALVAHTHVVLSLGHDVQLRFVDPRTFGEVFVTAPLGPGGDVPELAHLGVEPLAAATTSAVLAAMLAVRRTKVKPLIMEQRWMVGIGNMYADEILWTARLHPDRPAAGLSAPESRALHRSIRTVLRAAIRHRGSSLADEQYRDVHGRIGGYQAFHRAYGRTGEPCPRCGTPIVRLRAYGRSTHLCPRCQR
jgi:formamidopyrimidine-DNA glycosylase